MSRKLATIQRIAEVKSIPNADMIEAYRINGWWVVDSKDKYKEGDLVIYCEVDSWIPNSIAAFLSKGKEPKIYEGVSGERLRTIRLKGQLSQGLLLDLNTINLSIYANADNTSSIAIGTDVADLLGITKWEATLPACLVGDAEGLFPSFIPKTEQERIQNAQFNLEGQWEVTEKLHGSSCTMFLTNEKFGVCSRNLELKRSETNAYWKAAEKFKVEQAMLDNNLQGFAIQGELIGEGINGNQYKTNLDFYVFDIYDFNSKRWLLADERVELIAKLGLLHVPVIGKVTNLYEQGIVQILASADGISKLNGSTREGLVFKRTENGEESFKAVSNKWLLKNE